MGAMKIPDNDPIAKIARRGFLYQAGGGFFGAALGAMFAADGKLKDPHMGPQFPPKAKSVIFLFMCQRLFREI